MLTDTFFVRYEQAHTYAECPLASWEPSRGILAFLVAPVRC